MAGERRFNRKPLHGIPTARYCCSAMPVFSENSRSNTERDVMTLGEAAQRLDTTVAIVRRAVRNSKLPGLKIGGRWFVLRRPFERIMDRGFDAQKAT